MSAKLTVDALLERVTVTTGECWLVPTSRPRGYAEVANRQAHVFVYERTVGPVPQGLQLDHLCHSWDFTCAGGPACYHRACVNPRHLEPVTAAENRRRTLIRTTHCPSGHPYAGENLMVWSSGERRCRKCHRESGIRRGRANGVKPKRRDDFDTHCARGHAYEPGNVIIEKTQRGERTACKTCRRAAQRAYKLRQRAS